MQLLTPLVSRADAPLARANPVAKLGAAAVLMVTLFASIDGITAVVILAGLVSLLPWSGLSPRDLLSRAWLVGLGVVSIGVFNTVFAAEQLGPTVVDVGPLRIGSETLVNGLGLGVRLLAIVLAGLLATATTQPTDLADALVQQLRVSPRFAVGALAAMRLLPILSREWQVLAMARRARGVDAGRSPIAALRLFAGQLLAILVTAIRRGTRMALAMEARGFGAMPCRTSARVQRMRRADWGWVAGALLLGVVAVGTSIALGTWRPLLG
ncbi:MAG TPA: energy-coupling factor transporter transmembrane component T [Candidatus Limnocylindria bacterium]|nr:energy-coupling factor transporter transmembrane component T [Candidatus Limnocylindria bacterium]